MRGVALQRFSEVVNDLVREAAAGLGVQVPGRLHAGIQQLFDFLRRPEAEEVWERKKVSG